VVLWLLSQVHMAPPEAVRESLQQELAMLSHARKDMPLLVLFSVVVPALVEELFFRGFLFGAVRRVCGGWTTIVGTALAFGLLHVVMGGALGLNQFLPSTLMGLILGWVRHQSGSLIPGMILHAVHNGLLMVAAPVLLEEYQLAAQSAQVPVEWVLAGIGGTALGTWLVWMGRRRNTPASVEA
jgi:ABC-2 type transport system permease protein/sodium transport system permease protein